jgi:hypothetical protein
MYDLTLFNWTVKKNHTLSFSVVFTYFNLGSFDWSLLKKTFLSDLFQLTSLKLHSLPDCFVTSSKLVTIFRRTDILRIVDISLKPELSNLRHKHFVAKISIGKTSYEPCKVIGSKYDILVKMQPFFSGLHSTSYFFFFFRYLEYSLLYRTLVFFNNY